MQLHSRCQHVHFIYIPFSLELGFELIITGMSFLENISKFHITSCLRLINTKREIQKNFCKLALNAISKQEMFIKQVKTFFGKK